MSNKTLVFGASLKKNRYSNIAINMLKEYDFNVVAFGLKKGIVAGVEISNDLKNDEFSNVHTVTLYINAKRQIDYYDCIIGLKPKRIIFNPGTENWVFFKLLDKNKIEYEIACTLTLLRTQQF